jgi:DNA topoisomerase-3
MGNYFWACSTGKKGNCPLLRDDNGSPGKPIIDPGAPKAPCPTSGCKNMVTLVQSQNNKDFYFWKCADPSHPLRLNDNGKPGEEMTFGKKKSQSRDSGENGQ